MQSSRFPFIAKGGSHILPVGRSMKLADRFAPKCKPLIFPKVFPGGRIPELSNRAEKVTSGANGSSRLRFGARSVCVSLHGNGATMTAQDRDYFMLRARQ